jgi:hypothetical protein
MLLPLFRLIRLVIALVMPDVKLAFLTALTLSQGRPESDEREKENVNCETKENIKRYIKVVR